MKLWKYECMKMFTNKITYKQIWLTSHIWGTASGQWKIIQKYEHKNGP
jgi:hypothetical protein